MATMIDQEERKSGTARVEVPRDVAPDGRAARSRLTTEEVWREIAKASFAVVGYVTPGGDPRASGVIYRTVGRRLYIAVAPESWKARHIARSGRVSVTVPVRRGGALALVLPIPPATVGFHGTAIVHPAGSPQVRSLTKELASLLPAERQSSSCVIEVAPEGAFVTYGLGVSLKEMRDPAVARARVPVSRETR